MKNTGIIRRPDHLGRIVLPKEMRILLGLTAKEPVLFWIEGETIVCRRHHPDACHFTGVISENNYKLANGKIVLTRYAAKQLAREIKKNIYINS
ncbi:MAG: AbrB/MazE/SpoVT family DNA-binding domain-containing protein [Bacillota bacterium]